MRSIAFVSFALLSLVGASSAQEAKPETEPAGKQEAKTPAKFELESLTIYNPLDEFAERSPSAEVISSFVLKVEKLAEDYWKDLKPGPGQSGVIAVAIRPDRTMKFWVDLDEESQPEATEHFDKLSKSLGVPHCKIGPIAFALNIELNGGSKKPRAEDPTYPQAWREAARRSGMRLKVPDGILPLVWKDGESERQAVFAPEGYEAKTLNPIGGKMLVPKGWFFVEGHRNNVYMWTISKEDPTARPYETGVIVQLLYGTKEASGQSAADLVRSVIDMKKKSAKVLSERPQVRQGPFTRVGLEIIENQNDGKGKNLRVLYSCFWMDEADLGVIVFASTTEDQWDRYSETFDTMCTFELFDLERLRKTFGADEAEAKPENPPKP